MERGNRVNKMSLYIGCFAVACLFCMGYLPREKAIQIAKRFDGKCVSLNDFSNMTNALMIATNDMSVTGVLVQDGLKYSYFYALLDCDFPKEIQVRLSDGKEYRTYYQGKGKLIRCVELRNNVPNGDFFDFYTNGNVQAYMNISNGVVVSRIFYDATGKKVFQSESPVDLGKMTIIK